MLSFIVSAESKAANLKEEARTIAPFAALTSYEEIVQATAKAHEKAVAGG